MRELWRALVVVVAVNAVGVAPGIVFGADTGWFEKPWFFPPEWLFGVIWPVLFTLMGVAAYLVWRRGLDTQGVPLALGLFLIQLALNVSWTPAFFGLRHPGLGLAVIVALVVVLVPTVVAFGRVDRRAGLLLIPYLLWVGFATVLNAAIYLE